MSAFRSIGPIPWGSSEPGPRQAGAYEQARHPARSRRLGVGTLACSRCDVPVAIGPDPVSLTDELDCPFCQNRGPVRDFLSLAAPTRPARVVVSLTYPSEPGSSR